MHAATSGETLLTRHYRVVLDCSVRIHAVAPEEPSVGSSGLPLRSLQPREPASAESLDDQRILQDALLATPEALDGWLESVVWVELEELGFESPKSNGEPFLLPVVERLAPPLRQRFREAICDGRFYDETIEFNSSFTCHLRFVGIADMSDPDYAICRASTDRTRRYSIVLGYEIAVKDFIASEIEACYVDACKKWAEEYPDHASLGLRAIPTSQEVEDQRTLLRHLLDSAEVLEAWLRDLVMLDLEMSEAVEGANAVNRRDQLLTSVIEGLPPRLRHRFREAISEDRLIEVAEEFWDAFDVSGRVLEIQRLGP